MPKLPKRISPRLTNFNYSSTNMYFITVCTHERKNLFGEIVKAEMELNWKGKIVEKTWLNLPQYYPNTVLDKFIVIPNHFHGLISIFEKVGDEFNSSRNIIDRADLKPVPTKQHGLSEVIRGFKSFSTRKINKTNNSPGAKLWQRSFYDHIIRNNEDYYHTQMYIESNPLKWEWDNEKRD